MPRQYRPTLLRSDRIYGQLLMLVRGMTADERLPPVRRLMAQFAVSQVTVDRALSQLKQEGYIRAEQSRGLFVTGKREAGTVALLMHDAMSHFELQALRHCRAVFAAAGYNVQLATYHLPDGIAGGLRTVTADALLVLPAGSRRILEELAELRPAATPTVVLDLVPEDLDLNAVGTDNDFGGALAAKHLLDLGHRRIGILLAEPAVSSQRERVAGFLRQAALHGVENITVIDGLAQLVASGERMTGGTFGVARWATQRLLREHGNCPFTALFTESDLGALGVMKTLHENGIAMPGAVSVIGFDDLPEARYTHPALTTIRQDQVGWCQAALAIIEERRQSASGPATRVRVRPELVLRESTAAPAAP